MSHSLAERLQLHACVIVQHGTPALVPSHRLKPPDITELEQSTGYFECPLTLFLDGGQMRVASVLAQSGARKYVHTLWNSSLLENV